MFDYISSIPNSPPGEVKIVQGNYVLYYKNAVYVLCKVNPDNSFYIDEIAETARKSIDREERMKTWK